MGVRIQCVVGRAHHGLVLGDEPIVIGGRTGAIRVPGATVTRKHARFYRQAGQYFVEDLGGAGVWVNGERIERRELFNRDRIRVGEVEIDFFAD